MRQRINANWVRALLEPFDWAEWLFHIDGDEVALLDREALAAVPAEIDAVWLVAVGGGQPVDPAAQRPTRFKRLLEEADLNLLHVLGAISRADEPGVLPRPRHGQVRGAAGVGSRADPPRGGLGGRQAPDAPRGPAAAGAALRRPSGEEFVRKWTALATAGPARYRAVAGAVGAGAAGAGVSSDLPDEIREKYLRRIYDLTTRDDVELLDELGLLVEHDPERGGSTPRPLPEGAAEQLASRVAELSASPEAAFFVDDAPDRRASGGNGAAQAAGPPGLTARSGRARRRSSRRTPAQPGRSPGTASPARPAAQPAYVAEHGRDQVDGDLGDLLVGHRQGLRAVFELLGDPEVLEVPTTLIGDCSEVVDGLVARVGGTPRPGPARARTARRRRGTNRSSARNVRM